MVSPLTTAALFLGFVFVLALLVWANARQRTVRSGVPEGHLVFQDSDRHHQLTRPLLSQRYGLVGKPDYLVKTAEAIIPVEIKSRNCPCSGPQASDIAQLTAYCVLVEDTLSGVPSYGIIQYPNRSSRIEYTPRGRERVLQIMEEMRQARDWRTVHRSHSKPSRCRACGFRAVCDDRIE